MLYLHWWYKKSYKLNTTIIYRKMTDNDNEKRDSSAGVFLWI